MAVKTSKAFRALQIVEPCDGGVFRHVDALVKYLLGRGVEVGLASSTHRDSDWRSALENKVSGPTLDMHVGAAPALTDLRALSRLYKVCKEWRPDVIHGHSSKGGGLARLLSLAYPQAKVFYTPNAYVGFAAGGITKRSIYNFAESLLGRVGQTINVSSDENRFAVEKLGLSAQSTIIIPNAVDTHRYRPVTGEPRNKVRSQLGIPNSATLLTTIARYCDQKDPFTFYKALIPVLQQTPSAWLLHIGKGEMKSEVVTMCKQAGVENRIVRIEFASDTAEYLSSSDGFVLASLYEGFPISVVEALACNLPIVIANCQGNRDFAGLGLSHCWYYSVRDSEELKKSVFSLLDSLRSPSPSNHRGIACERFSEEKCFGQILGLYRKACGYL